MTAVDRRLLTWCRATRAFLATTVALGVLRAFLLIAQAFLLATVISGAFMSHRTLSELRTPMALLALVVALRALVSWSAELSANRCAARVKSLLRAALVKRITLPGGDGQVIARSGDVATLAVRGVDSLDGYFARYVPQSVLAAIVPLTILVAVFWADWISGVIMAVTLPLVPVFMALIGMATRDKTSRQLRSLQQLAGHFLDVVGGLPTLKVFGRSRPQARVIGQVTDTYRRRLMATLRVTFLSSLVLELCASVSVALIAVAIGLRLLDGHMTLLPALFVLVLAPEAYLPLRQLAADYHASAAGASAAENVFEIIDRPVQTAGRNRVVPDPARMGISVEGLRFAYPGRPKPALDGVTFDVAPGEVLAVTGPSGCGKSTLLAALLCLVQPDSGRILVGGADLASLDPDAWRRRVAWVPQHPHLFATTIADNVRLGRADASPEDVERAIADAGLSQLVARLPLGLDTVLGERGAGLSAGERQRVALARAFLRDSPLLLLDEPTANLDGETEEEVAAAVRRLSRGRTVVLVAHRPGLLTIADRVVDLAPELVPA